MPSERCKREKTLISHVRDENDLDWSGSARFLVSTIVENAFMVWNVPNPASTPVSFRNNEKFRSESFLLTLSAGSIGARVEVVNGEPKRKPRKRPDPTRRHTSVMVYISYTPVPEICFQNS